MHIKFAKGTLIHIETDEAIAQMNPQSEEETVEETDSKASVAVSNAGSQAASAAGSSASVAQAEEKPAAKKKEKLIRNQFNYQERGTQSGNYQSVISFIIQQIIYFSRSTTKR